MRKRKWPMRTVGRMEIHGKKLMAAQNEAEPEEHV